MSEEAALLFANEAFYRAFADRDIQAMQDVWADDAPVACIHPGWAPLLGRKPVLESWAAILSGPNAPDIECQAAKALPCGDAGLVLCYERIGENVLVATNLFVRRGPIWKMIHHQAGPMAQPVEGELPPTPTEARH